MGLLCIFQNILTVFSTLFLPSSYLLNLFLLRLLQIYFLYKCLVFVLIFIVNSFHNKLVSLPSLSRLSVRSFCSFASKLVVYFLFLSNCVFLDFCLGYLLANVRWPTVNICFTADFLMINRWFIVDSFVHCVYKMLISDWRVE